MFSENTWRHAKAALPEYGARKKDIAAYMATYMWFRSLGDQDPFEEICKLIATYYVVPGL